MSSDSAATGGPTTAQRTPLHALHEALGARLVPFAGYAMPVQYPGGIKREHLHTREQAGLFDVSHMGQIVIEGPAAALESVVPGDIAGLGEHRQRYSVLTDPRGGIIDDVMITRLPDRFFVVVNAAFKERDRAHLDAALHGDCTVAMLEDRALLALQGPAAVEVLQELHPPLAGMPFMSAIECTLAAAPCVVNRCGYTGEDGFEISVPASHAEALARRLLEHSAVEPVGLGARDSLRLEAGLCLSGTDIDETTTPVEAGLAWTIARKYRDGAQAPRFPGAEAIMRQLREGCARRRVGLEPRGRVPLRGGVVLADGEGRDVGRVTSGTFGPSVDHPVAMGYVDTRHADVGTSLSVTIRDRTHAVEVAALPFVEHRYHRP